jgi:protein-disulfide isomerase
VYVDKKAWIIFGVIVVGLFGALIWYNQSTKTKVDVSNIKETSIQKASDQNGNIADHVLGSTAGKVTIVEYGDYECIYCYQAYPQLKAIMETYGDNVTFIFRNFPLSQLHPNALAAAAAAEAAGLQGKYWEMHDQLYVNHTDWVSLKGEQRNSVFESYAKAVGVDITKYNAALADGAKAVNQKIAFDRALGATLNVNSTPAIFVDGVQIDDATNVDIQQSTGSKLMDQLDAKLKAAGLPVPTRE